MGCDLRKFYFVNFGYDFGWILNANIKFLNASYFIEFMLIPIGSAYTTRSAYLNVANFLIAALSFQILFRQIYMEILAHLMILR